MVREGPGGQQSDLSGGTRLLVVDDDRAICRRLATGLSKVGYHVVTAYDVASAIAQAKATPPDVAIVDLRLPSGSGIDLVRHLKEAAGPAVHVIVLTGRDDERSRREAFAAGTDDYVVKPAALAELRRRIDAAIRTQRAYIQLRVDKEAAERRLVYGQEAAALLAHDLNNGLTVSLSNLSFLLDVIKGDPDQTDALAATLRSVRRMSSLVGNFVDIARFEDAGVKPSVEKTRIRELLTSVIEVHAPSITHGVSIEVECDPALVGRLDPGLVERVLHNLFGNAMRYCSRDGTIVLGARRWHDTEDDSVEIAVSNSGPPIPEAIRPSLFGKYVRGQGGKRGMGLYFCRLVAEAHGGRIDYEERETGPSFVIRLPGHA